MENTNNATAPAAPARPARESAEGRAARGREKNGAAKRARFTGPRPPRNCPFCVAKVKYIDYKQSDLLKRYLTERGKIKARRKIGTCAKHQRRLALAIKRARHIALLPFTAEHVRSE